MLNKTKNNSKGFTIIEVMIVLAIAGLIMLIVFLAVPALQRNSRNTQAKNEASNLLAAVGEYVSNNNGSMPTTAAHATSIVSASNVKNITSMTIEGSTGTTAPTSTRAVLRTGVKCNAAVTSGFTGGVTTAGSSRQYALIYPMEDKAGDATGCIDS